MEIVFRSQHKEDEVELSFDGSDGEVQINLIGGEEKVTFVVSYEQWSLLDNFMDEQRRKHEYKQNNP